MPTMGRRWADDGPTMGRRWADDGLTISAIFSFKYFLISKSNIMWFMTRWLILIDFMLALLVFIGFHDKFTADSTFIPIAKLILFIYSCI